MLFDEMEENEEDMLFDEAESSDLIDAPSDIAEILSPRATSQLLGHSEIEQKLLSMLEHGRFPHGLIFSGLEGVGKSVMAYRLARYLFAQDAKEDDTFNMFGDAPEKATSLFISPNDDVFAKVVSGGHPDLMIVERPVDEKTGLVKASVPVDEIRKIAPFMHNMPSVQNGWRIVIIDDADTMTRSSQNSLLKILEEPPEKSLLILIAHRAGALLPTIYSRCVHLPFGSIPDDVMKTALMGRCPADKIPLILSMSEGSLGAAHEYTDDQNADLIAKTIELLNDGQKLQWSPIQEFADMFGSKGNEDSQRIFRETMLWIAGGLMRNRVAGFDVLKSQPMARKIKLYDDLKAHFDRCIIGNLDKRFMIVGAYMAFE